MNDYIPLIFYYAIIHPCPKHGVFFCWWKWPHALLAWLTWYHNLTQTSSWWRVWGETLKNADINNGTEAGCRHIHAETCRNIHAETKWPLFCRWPVPIHFLYENVWISNIMSLKCAPKGPTDNIPALVQKMAWRRPGDKPLTEPMMVRLPTHICVTGPQLV